MKAVIRDPWRYVASGTTGSGTTRPLGFTRQELDKIFLRAKDFKITANLTSSDPDAPDLNEETNFSDGVGGDVELPPSEIFLARGWDAVSAWPPGLPLERFRYWVFTQPYGDPPPDDFSYGISVLFGSDGVGTPLVQSGSLFYPFLRVLVATDASHSSESSETSPTFPDPSGITCTVFGKTLPLYISPGFYALSGTLDIGFCDPADNGFFSYGGLVNTGTGAYTTANI